MSLVFVDAGGWIALINRRDRLHGRARAYYAEQLERRSRFLTTNYVIDETATRLRYDAGLPAAIAFRGAVDKAVAQRRLRVHWVDPRTEREGWEILERYADVPLSLTDATSAAVGRRARVHTVFGFDADFHALGFDVQPAT